jgi:hypothetical protein
MLNLWRLRPPPHWDPSETNKFWPALHMGVTLLQHGSSVRVVNVTKLKSYGARSGTTALHIYPKSKLTSRPMAAQNTASAQDDMVETARLAPFIAGAGQSLI